MKAGRNDPCPCGSGLKYKKCCGRQEAAGGNPAPVPSVEEAMRLHQAGNLDQAVNCYREILQRQPRNADALHLLGVARHQQGDSAGAVEMISGAIAINSAFAPYHFSLGNVLKEMGRLDDAAGCYERATRIDARAAGAWFALGNTRALQERFAEAEACFEKALALEPGLAAAHHNLADVLKNLGRPGEAIAHYREVLKLDPGFADTWLSLGNLLKGEGRLAEAAESYLGALRIRPDWAKALNNLGNTLKEQGKGAEAEEYYRRALAAKPDMPGVLMNLCNALKQQDKTDEAIACYRQELALRPDNEKARYLLAAMEKDWLPEQAPRAYVQDLFNSYAKDFDKHLQEKLGYKVPPILVEAAVQAFGERTDRYDILDLGCGTGLCGHYFQDAVRSLVGVDLAQGMIAEAEKRGIYSRLVCGDVLEFLEREPEDCYDIVVAADVFIYIGELGGIFRHVHRLLRPGGIFAFSEETGEDREIALRDSGRYAHSPEYTRRLGKESGFAEVRSIPVEIRRHKNLPIDGSIFIFRKP